MNANENPQKTVLIHQYLYYVAASPVWSDYQYDMFCDKHGVEGGGGSDRECDYPEDVIQEAREILSGRSTIR